MGNNRETVLSRMVWTLCVVGPPIFLLSLRLLFHSAGVGACKWQIAGWVVVAWSVLIGYWMRVAWRNAICGQYKRAFCASVIEQTLGLSLAALMLDGGLTLYGCLLAGVMYWMIAGLVVARRPIVPTRCDLRLVAHGFLSLAFPVTVVVWTWQYHYWE